MDSLSGHSSEYSPHQSGLKTVCSLKVAQFNHASQKNVLVVDYTGYTSSLIHLEIGAQCMQTLASNKFDTQSGISKQEIFQTEVVGGSNLRCAWTWQGA